MSKNKPLGKMSHFSRLKTQIKKKPELIEALELLQYNVEENHPLISEFDSGTPVLPLTQLMMVLPPQSSYLVPPSYATLMKQMDSPIIEYYPLHIECESYYKKWFHETIPKLSSIHMDKILEAVEPIKLNKTEEKRNCLEKIVVFAC